MTCNSLTIIIPSCDRPKLLQNAIGSVQANGGHELPIIIIDDGVRFPVNASELPARITLLKTDGKVGAGRARNLGVQSANTDYVLFLDDDDVFINGYVAYVLNECIASVFKVGVASTSADVRKKSRTLNKNTSLLKYIFGAGSGLWVERELFLSIKGFGEKEIIDEDTHFFCKLREEDIPIFATHLIGVNLAPASPCDAPHNSLTRNISQKKIADAYHQTANNFIHSHKLSTMDKFDLVARSARVISRIPKADVRTGYKLNSTLWSLVHTLLVTLRYWVRQLNGTLSD